MSIIHDYAGIAAHLRGDDWWKPRKAADGLAYGVGPCMVLTERKSAAEIVNDAVMRLADCRAYQDAMKKRGRENQLWQETASRILACHGLWGL